MLPSSDTPSTLRSAGLVRSERIDRGVVLAAAARRSGLRWLAALLDSHPRSLCRDEPFERVYYVGLKSVVRRLQKTGALSRVDRDRLIDEWTNNTLHSPPALFFKKQFAEARPVQQWWSWVRARWSERFRSEYVAVNSPAENRPYDLVLTQTSSSEYLASVAQGLNARLFVLRRHPGAVVASQLRGLRRGYLPPLDRVGWFEENQRACRELELRLSSVLRMPITELLAYQWLAQNMQFRAVLSQLPHSSLAMQFEDFCRDPEIRARELFAFLGWDFTEQTRDFIQQSMSGGWLSPYGWCTGRRRYATVFRHSANICDAWRNEMTDYEQSRIMSIAGAMPQFRRFWRE
jgi:Sulfotransferase domain